MPSYTNNFLINYQFKNQNNRYYVFFSINLMSSLHGHIVNSILQTYDINVYKDLLSKKLQVKTDKTFFFLYLYIQFNKKI